MLRSIGNSPGNPWSPKKKRKAMEARIFRQGGFKTGMKE